MLPVLWLPSKRALPALVPLITTDGLAALADDHAAVFADAVTVLSAEVAQEQVVDFRVGGRQMDTDRLRADVPRISLGVGNVKSFQFFTMLDLDGSQKNRLTGGGHAANDMPDRAAVREKCSRPQSQKALLVVIKKPSILV